LEILSVSASASTSACLLKLWYKIYTTGLFTSSGNKTTCFTLISNPKLKNQQDRTPHRSVWTAMSYSSGTTSCDARSAIPVWPYRLGGLLPVRRDEMGDLG
jgi:hypothetical protein